MTDPQPTIEVRADPAPTPAQRVSRTAGQSGGVVLLIELWQSFGWFGADHWTAEQSAQRWPAVTAVAIFIVAVAHNSVNWWRSERLAPPLQAVTVMAEPEADTPKRRRR